jgi:hypothetical protein
LAHQLALVFQIIKMKDEILVDNIKFWVDQNIIYCKLYGDFDDNYFESVFENVFTNAITKLSDGKYMPVLFNLREIDNLQTIKIFKRLSNNALIKSSVLTKTFLVRSLVLKVILSCCDLAKNPNDLNKICTDKDLAIKHCIKNNKVFNAIK